MSSNSSIMHEASAKVKIVLSSYPNATVATTTCILEEIQSSKIELRNLSFNPAWYAEEAKASRETVI